MYSPNEQDHRKHLQIVFEILQHHVFFANAKKCALGKTKIDYLGYIVSGRGVEVIEKKIAAVIDWPMPTSVKDLRGFWG